MINCPSCGREQPEDLESGQCRHCGHAWGVLKLDSMGILDFVKAEVGYGAEKSWLEQWGQVQRSYMKVQNLYTADVHNEDAQSVVKDFFIHCWHLSDWLKKDPATSVGREDIGALLSTEYDMRVCNAMANTSKHHTLVDGKMSVRVSRMVTQPQAQVTLEITPVEGEATERDALDLATSCMNIWRRYLKSYGLTP